MTTEEVQGWIDHESADADEAATLIKAWLATLPLDQARRVASWLANTKSSPLLADIADSIVAQVHADLPAIADVARVLGMTVRGVQMAVQRNNKRRGIQRGPGRYPRKA